MRIGELSRQTGVPRDTIRFYEREGLIRSAPSADATNSYRDYGEEVPERLQMIAEAQEAGLRLADLAVLIRMMELDEPEATDVEGFLDGRIAQVEATIRRARRFLSFLRETRAALARAPLAAAAEALQTDG
ncbi:MAG: MerR family transcriptional regulator [Paracoccaceae bacterium]